jgi:hypothetical protein
MLARSIVLVIAVSFGSASANATSAPSGGTRGFFCVKNPKQNEVMYFSLRYDTGGNSNITLQPGQKHRWNNVSDRDHLCVSLSPFNNECPGMTRVQLNNSAACP